MRKSQAPSQLIKRKQPDDADQSRQPQESSTDLTTARESENLRTFNVVYAAFTRKKHKTFTDEGTLEIQGRMAVLKDTDGKVSLVNQIRRELAH